ncbi:hypothetical protein M5K25_020965 [Dendrobium thyrsiflorum]|uniref:Uncharacterized protein n=1 Tax=Dendrobium thyrsiflorum TaxID=117978 RepID=A0ABD0UBG2_DENTH
MSPRQNYQQPLQEEEIEDLLQEIARLKLRLLRINERKRDVSPLAQDFTVQPQGKSTTIAAYRSSDQTKCLQTDNDDEDILDDQFFFFSYDVFEGIPRQSSTPPSIESGLEDFEYPLPKSLSLPRYDEPVYDVYDDDMFDGVINLEQPTYDVNERLFHSAIDLHQDSPLILVPGIHHYGFSDSNSEASTTDSVINNDFMPEDAELEDENISLPFIDFFIHKPGVEFHSTLEECRLQVLLKTHFEFVCYLIRHRFQLILKSLINGKNDTGWKYPNRFSQPRLPP